MTSVANPPRLTVEDAGRLAAELFGVSGQTTPLPSERDQNFLVHAGDGARYVLKIANAHEPGAMLEAENAVMRHLAATGLVPVPVPTRAGGDIERSGDHFVRLVTGLGGEPMGNVRRHTHALLEDLGRTVGKIDQALSTFDHAALHRTFYWDLATAAPAVRAHAPKVQDAGLRSAIETALDIYETSVVPHLSSLRRSAIHGDVNDYNVLVDAGTQRLTGIVDFGDMVVSHTVNDVAIAMAYAALGKPDPLAAAAEVLRGSHAVFPLNDDELACAFGLMLLRLSLSVAVAAAQQADRPGDEYLAISQQPIRQTLPKLAAIHPRLAHYLLRDACGVPPVPHSPKVADWLRTHVKSFASITGHNLRAVPVLGLDLSAGSPLVSSDPAENAAEPFGRRVFAAIQEAGAALGAGGYDEARLIYAADAYAAGV